MYQRQFRGAVATENSDVQEIQSAIEIYQKVDEPLDVTIRGDKQTAIARTGRRRQRIDCCLKASPDQRVRGAKQKIDSTESTKSAI